jgi:translocator protein
MLLAVLSLGCILVSAIAFAWVLVHAFRRSVGTGVMVLCIPFYNVYYGVMQFQHPRKNVIVALWLGGFALGATFWAAAMRT